MDLAENNNGIVQNESIIEHQNNDEANIETLQTSTQPIEEILGSTYNNLDDVFGTSKNCQVRTSARVFKKMKLDNAQAVVTSPIIDKEKKDVLCDPKTEIKKQARPFWSTEDKDAFFEALNDHGKDFDAIQQHVNRIIKRKGLPSTQIKTKEQVRHFYHRTWHKVSKHLKFTEDIKKVAQELYALINYGELRKKVGSVSEKVCMKVNELMYKGTVVIRKKGRNIRVKTPMCRALRKLNQLDEKHEELKLPTRVIVELRPKNMETWLCVQYMSQNPRIRLSLTLQRRLSALLHCLNERWKTQVSRAHETVHSYTSSHCTFNRQSPTLRLAPRSDATVELPSINLSEFWTSHRISFSAYEERIGVKVPGEQLWPHMFPSFKGGGKSSTKKGTTKRQRNESTGEKTPSKSKETCDEVDENPTTVSDVVDTAINTILSLQMQNHEDGIEAELIKEESKLEIENSDASIPFNKEEEIEKIRNGWTIENCGALTIGELYLMFGQNSKLELQYSWDLSDDLKTEPLDSKPEPEIAQIEPETEPNKTTTDLEPKSITSEGEIDPKKSSTEVNLEPSSNDLSLTLKKLLSIAKLHYRKERIRCPCGHICGGAKTNSANRNKSLISKSSQKVAEVSPQNCMRNVTVKTEPMFRKPTIFPSNGAITDSFRAQLDSLQKMRPKYTNRKGRPVRSKHVVVERMLPLLPKPLLNGHSLVTMKVISQSDDLTRTKLRPIAPRVEENSILEQENKNGTEFTVANDAQIEEQEMEEEKRVSSPTSISNLLNLELQGTDTADLISGDTKNLTSFAGLLSDELPDNATPIPSPSRILKENDTQWLNSEVNDYSLTSLLGHLESPMKTVTPTVIPCDDAPMTEDIDSQFPSLLGENGVDFVDQFVDMAAQVDTDPEIGQLNG